MAKLKKQIKKKFFRVEVPILRKEIELYSKDIPSLEGRFVKINLANELKGKALDLKLKVKATQEKAEAHPIQAKILPSYLRRVMRKGVDYSENSFITKCKDHKIKIKPFMITRKRVTRKVLAGLSKEGETFLKEYVKDRTFEYLISDLISGKLQKQLNIKMKKIYPLGLCEIKYLGIYNKQNYGEEEIVEEESSEQKLTVEEPAEQEKSKKIGKTKEKQPEQEEKPEESSEQQLTEEKKQPKPEEETKKQDE